MNKMIVFFAFMVVFAFLIHAAVELRDFGEPENSEMDDHMIEEGQNETGSNNIVTSVVFDYRGFDTLGEATVLFTAVTSVAMVLRKAAQARKKPDGPGEGSSGESAIEEEVVVDEGEEVVVEDETEVTQ